MSEVFRTGDLGVVHEHLGQLWERGCLLAGGGQLHDRADRSHDRAATQNPAPVRRDATAYLPGPPLTYEALRKAGQRDPRFPEPVAWESVTQLYDLDAPVRVAPGEAGGDRGGSVL
jgi:hypothetical protein